MLTLKLLRVSGQTNSKIQLSAEIYLTQANAVKTIPWREANIHI